MLFLGPYWFRRGLFLVDKQAAVPKAALKKWELNLNADNNYELAAA